MATWIVKVTGWGTPDETTVEADTIGEAVQNGLEEMGFFDNDEGTYTIKVAATIEAIEA